MTQIKTNIITMMQEGNFEIGENGMFMSQL